MTLILDNLFHSYDAHKTLQGVSLRVEQGEIVSLLGPSGCGKTTLLRLIAGLERLDGGVIRLDDRILASKTAHPGCAASGIRSNRPYGVSVAAMMARVAVTSTQHQVVKVFM